jgi:hypothetical protein
MDILRSEAIPKSKKEGCEQMTYFEARQRIPTQAERIINLLKEAGADGVSNIELSKISLKYDARICELRMQGYEIETTHEKKGVYKYFLIKTPSNDFLYLNATDEILMMIATDFDGSIEENELKNLLIFKHFHITRKSGWYKHQMKIH